jgi:hypothetical protein
MRSVTGTVMWALHIKSGAEERLFPYSPSTIPLEINISLSGWVNNFLL